ncbi:hypothetical protein EDB85DRAFT_2288535 [Lactarius pseudohatsudake]|nr:hypothetical protein EDB85DRAFT_2288535 [Lactarius pseudohatsudake]
MESRGPTSTHSLISLIPEELVEHGISYPLQRMDAGFTVLLHVIIHIISGFEAIVDEDLSHYQNSDAQDMVFVDADIERGDDAVLCLERLFATTRHYKLSRTWSTTFARRSRVLCFQHEHKIAHCAYGDDVMDISRSCSAGFDRTRLPVRYYRVNFSRAQELLREADPRSASLCRDVCDCGALFQTLVDEVPKIGGKLRSLVVAMTGGEYGADDPRKLFEALCKGVDAATYDTPLQIPWRN